MKLPQAVEIVDTMLSESAKDLKLENLAQRWNPVVRLRQAWRRIPLKK